MLSKDRDADSARSFFVKSIKSSGTLGKTIGDKSETNQAGFIAINLRFVIFSNDIFNFIYIQRSSQSKNSY
jgi:transposase-like protein